jgi:hypothetical protein
MLVSVLVLLLMAAAAIIPIILGLPEWAVYTILAAVAAVLSLLALAAVLSAADRRYRQIEV